MNILVPTDFSNYALYALRAATELLKTSGGVLTLFHNQSQFSDEYPLDDNTYSDNLLAIEERLKQLIDGVNIKQNSKEYILRQGRFLNNLKDIVEDKHIDLIVMGSHGMSGKSEWFIGSNSQKVVREVRINTLIVKNPIEHLNLKKVLYVTSLDSSDLTAFRVFLKFMESYTNVEVHVVSIDTSSWFTQPTIVMLEALKDFKEIASQFNCTTHFFKDYSVQSGIRHFIVENNIDLVGISYVSRNPIKRIFLGSNVELLINHSEIPVLCINSIG